MDGSHSDVYRKYIVNNDKRNDQCARWAEFDADSGRIVLVMCTQINHGKILKKMISDSVFINGTTSKSTRRKWSKEFRAGEIPIMICSSVWNVGVDFPVISSLVMAGPYKSAAVNLQRIGRGLRPYPEIGKVDCIVRETNDEAPYLRDWSMARHTAYSKEPEFVMA